jgi:hypothetical protein
MMIILRISTVILKVCSARPTHTKVRFRVFRTTVTVIVVYRSLLENDFLGIP